MRESGGERSAVATLPGKEQPGSARDLPVVECAGYLSKQLLTYLGSKRALLAAIEQVLLTVCRRTGREKLSFLDAFAGSGVVSRLMKKYACRIVVNDIESYARVVAQCYLTNKRSVDAGRLRAAADRLNEDADRSPVEGGFIQRLYSPRDECNITAGDRVFYTRQNAGRIDTYRQLIERQDHDLRPLLLAPLLSAASIHANTAGVFKGFYKDRTTKVGKFGGTGADALSRITSPIRIQAPVLSNFECEYEVFQTHVNDLVRKVGGFDLAYFDPPYNQHPYGSNYFMLNLITDYREPSEVSRISGIPTDWVRSGYNVRANSADLMEDLVASTDAQFILLSFNDEGFISPERMRTILLGHGKLEEFTTSYNTFRGSRNLSDRSLHVTEHLYLLEKG